MAPHSTPVRTPWSKQPGSKITTLGLGWVEDLEAQSNSQGFGVAGYILNLEEASFRLGGQRWPLG
jgi:hypothetical protein